MAKNKTITDRSIIKELLNELSFIIMAHREDVKLTCPEDCICYDIDELIIKYEAKMEEL